MGMWMRENLGVIVTVLVMVTSLGANVLQYQALQQRGEATRAGFRPGTEFPILEGVGLDGSSRTLQPRAETMLYVFSPNCGWCKADYENLRTLARSAGEQYRFVAVALSNAKAPAAFHESMAEYLNSRPFPGDVVLIDPDKLAPQVLRDIRLTPQTVVIDMEGKIARAWAGALMGERKVEAERFFGIALPGVQPEGGVR